MQKTSGALRLVLQNSRVEADKLPIVSLPIVVQRLSKAAKIQLQGTPMTNFTIELTSRYPDSQSGDLLRSDDKTPVSGGRTRIGRAAWPFLVGANRSPDGRDHRETLAGEPSFSS
jgi:hypothetical protein